MFLTDPSSPTGVAAVAHRWLPEPTTDGLACVQVVAKGAPGSPDVHVILRQCALLRGVIPVLSEPHCDGQMAVDGSLTTWALDFVRPPPRSATPCRHTLNSTRFSRGLRGSTACRSQRLQRCGIWHLPLDGWNCL